MIKTYIVGGFVRDTLLKTPPTDKDYVVVGATHDDMIRQGFSKVGVSFPVYLHPTTNEEYALARTEKKCGVGYHGFVVDASTTVTLEEDQSRRDLTINSMAMDQSTGEIIDPFNGQADLRNQVIRHTSIAFKDDPLRILRAFRFAAKFLFTIHPDTSKMILETSSELNEISHERFFQEFKKIPVQRLEIFFKLCLRYNLHRTVILLKSVRIPKSVIFSDDSDLNIGQFFADTSVLPSKNMRIASSCITRTESFDLWTTNSDEIYSLIRDFRLDRYGTSTVPTILSNSVLGLQSTYLKDCIRAYSRVAIPTEGDIGEQLRVNRIVAIERVMKAHRHGL